MRSVDEVYGLGAKVYVWPFEGWVILSGRSAIAEVYPALWSRARAEGGRAADQHDAFSVATWLAVDDSSGSLSGFLQPGPSEAGKEAVRVEGWILGIAGELDLLSGRPDDDRAANWALH